MAPAPTSACFPFPTFQWSKGIKEKKKLVGLLKVFIVFLSEDHVDVLSIALRFACYQWHKGGRRRDRRKEGDGMRVAHGPVFGFI